MTASRLGILAGGFLLIAIAASAFRADNVFSSTEMAEPDLIAVRKATERFRDVNVALAEGYIRDPFDLCDTAEMMGRPASLWRHGRALLHAGLRGIHSPLPRRRRVWERTWIF